VKKVGWVWLILSVLTFFSVTTVLAQAGTYTDSERYPFSQHMLNPCNGETIAFDGYLHETWHLTVDDNGGFHFRLQINPQNVVGEGLTTGATYRFSGTVNEVQNFQSAQEAANFTFIDQHRYIARGVSGNTVMQERYHVTVNANGDVTVDLVDLALICQ
jgi:hypothetical protein